MHAKWVADSIGWLLPFITSMVCEGWVLPRPPTCDSGSSEAPKRHRNTPTLSTASLGHHASIDMLAQAGAGPRAALLKCYRWLRNADPSPHCRLLIDGQLAPEEPSHPARCEQVSSQRAWPNSWDTNYDMNVRHRIKCPLGSGWLRRGSSIADRAIS